MSRSGATFAAALELFQAAMIEGRVERALSEARVAKLKAAAELERAGRYEEAQVLIDQVRTEQAEEAKARR